MAYRLKAKESLLQGIKRIIIEQTDKAIAELTNAEEIGIGEAVHQVRKRLKKNRAVIRLVRYSLGEKTFDRENRYFRDLGRELAGLRDGEVTIETLDNLSTHFSNLVQPESFTDIRRELRVDYRQEYQNTVNNDVLISVKHELKNVRERVEGWKLKSDDWSSIDKSFKRVYKRGYKDLHQAKAEPTAENLHEWRKRVKYLRYQLNILSPMWSALIKQWVDLTHDLTDYLGEDHDLAVLREFVVSQPERFNSQTNPELLISLCDRRQQQLQSAAINLGAKIYTEKPKRFSDRFGNYWRIWRQTTT